jgi:hypothetical protein
MPVKPARPAEAYVARTNSIVSEVLRRADAGVAHPWRADLNNPTLRGGDVNGHF